MTSTCAMRFWVLLGSMLLCQCVPDVGPPASLLLLPRVLAVRGEPPEVTPGASTHLTLFVAGPEAALSADVEAALSDAEWALCATPKPPVDNNFISDRCLNDDESVLPISARGKQVDVTVPANACALFGPQTPPQQSDQPPGRPRDPDESGGYYQPVRVRIKSLGLTAFAGVRILCGLPYATPEVAADYRVQYIPNHNPEVSAVRAFKQGMPQPLDTLPAGETISLRILPHPDSTETFVVFDEALQTLRPQPEHLRVSWFSGQGNFSFPTTTNDGPGEEIGNDWIAPSTPGPVLLWAVLRDSRGGVSVLSQSAQIR